jgi:hypothetical protein
VQKYGSSIPLRIKLINKIIMNPRQQPPTMLDSDSASGLSTTSEKRMIYDDTAEIFRVERSIEVATGDNDRDEQIAVVSVTEQRGNKSPTQSLNGLKDRHLILFQPLPAKAGSSFEADEYNMR